MSRDEPAPSRLRASIPPATGSRPLRPDPWEVVISDDLTDKQTELTEKLVELPRRSSGVIWFNSCGGSVYAGLALASIIRLRGLNATAVVAGECSSAALMPFAACGRRFVTPHATLLFHPVRWTGEEDMRLEEAAEWARHFAELESDLDRLAVDLFATTAPEIAERTAIAQQLQTWSKPGRFVTGTELASTGLAKLVSLIDGDLWQQIS